MFDDIVFRNYLGELVNVPTFYICILIARNTVHKTPMRQ